jgi:hypothetical protein
VAIKDTFSRLMTLRTNPSSVGMSVLVARFAWAELGLWIGDALPPGDWQELLAFEQVARTAEEVVTDRLAKIRVQPDAAVSSCARCRRDTMVRPHPRAGASCLICGHIPVNKESE